MYPLENNKYGHNPYNHPYQKDQMWTITDKYQAGQHFFIPGQHIQYHPTRCYQYFPPGQHSRTT